MSRSIRQYAGVKVEGQPGYSFPFFIIMEENYQNCFTQYNSKIYVLSSHLALHLLPILLLKVKLHMEI